VDAEPPQPDKIPQLWKNRIFPVIFRAESHHAGRFWSEKFSTGIDSKRVKNNMQGFEGKFIPLARGG
jgi:hypothetical protein